MNRTQRLLKAWVAELREIGCGKGLIRGECTLWLRISGRCYTLIMLSPFELNGTFPCPLKSSGILSSIPFWYKRRPVFVKQSVLVLKYREQRVKHDRAVYI